MTIQFFGALSRVVRLADRLEGGPYNGEEKDQAKTRGKAKAPASESRRYKDRGKYSRAPGAKDGKPLAAKADCSFVYCGTAEAVP